MINKTFNSTFGVINSDGNLLPNNNILYGPYNTKDEAFNIISSKLNNRIPIGLTVGIITNNVIVEYWFSGGITIDHLIPKIEVSEQLVDYDEQLKQINEKINENSDNIETNTESIANIISGNTRVKTAINATNATNATNANKANTLNNPKYINGFKFNNENNIRYYFICDTEANVLYKTLKDEDGNEITFNEDISLGAIIIVKFINGNSITQPRIKINDKVYVITYKEGNMRPDDYWNAGDVITFICISDPYGSRYLNIISYGVVPHKSLFADASNTSNKSNKLANSKTINNIPFDGTKNIKFYFNCDTDPDVKDKEIKNYTDQDELTFSDGTFIIVKFNRGNTSKQVNLKINNNSYPVKVNNSTSLDETWYAGEYIIFILEQQANQYFNKIGSRSSISENDLKDYVKSSDIIGESAKTKIQNAINSDKLANTKQINGMLFNGENNISFSFVADTIEGDKLVVKLFNTNINESTIDKTQPFPTGTIISVKINVNPKGINKIKIFDWVYEIMYNDSILDANFGWEKGATYILNRSNYYTPRFSIVNSASSFTFKNYGQYFYRIDGYVGGGKPYYTVNSKETNTILPINGSVITIRFKPGTEISNLPDVIPANTNIKFGDNTTLIPLNYKDSAIGNNILYNDDTATFIYLNNRLRLICVDSINTSSNAPSRPGLDDTYITEEGLNEILNEYVRKDNNNATINIDGKLNLTLIDDIKQAQSKLINTNQIAFYLISDSQGKLPSSEHCYTVPSENATILGLSSPNSITQASINLLNISLPSFGVNVGDLIALTRVKIKIADLGDAINKDLSILGNSEIEVYQYKILNTNDAKPYGYDGVAEGVAGLMTPWDKEQVNKINGIEYTANNALPKNNLLPSRWEANMNNALQTGVYPWCDLGRPAGSTGHYTCIVNKTSTDDGAFNTIEQTAYGREGELGQVYKRIIFEKTDGTDTQYGDWIKVSTDANGVSSGDIVPTCHAVIFPPAEIVQIMDVSSPIGFSVIAVNEDVSEYYAVPSYFLDGELIVCDIDYTYRIALYTDDEGNPISTIIEKAPTKSQVYVTKEELNEKLGDINTILESIING
jgi:hypothetical protein